MSGIEKITARLREQLKREPTEAELVVGLTAELGRLNNNLANPTYKLGDSGLSCRISEKGAVSVYGLGRWPVTLYGAQWEKLAMALPALQDFLLDNAGSLRTKDSETQTVTKADVGSVESVLV